MLREADFQLDLTVPGIRFKSERAGNGLITFLVLGDSLCFKIGNQGLILKDFIQDLMLKITR